MIKLIDGTWISPEAITRIAASEKMPGTMYHIMGSGTAFITTEPVDELAEKINEALQADAVSVSLDDESQMNMAALQQLLNLAEGGDPRAED